MSDLQRRISVANSAAKIQKEIDNSNIKRRFYIKYERPSSIDHHNIIEHIILNETDEHIVEFLNKFRKSVLEFRQL